MAVTIADLEINIQSTGNEMIATFTKLATKLNALSGHLDKATSSMKKVSKAMGDTGKEAKKAGEGAEKGAKGLGNFANSILRIMKYRAIRAVLKTITQGFREGVQNIALYSAAINEMDASKANNVMSAYASMGAQIKNSLGAAVMPLLANLLPVIQKVADMFMDAAEAVAQFFAALNGQSTYTAANREYWVDYAKGLQKSTGAAKELKRTILGFDEINALNSQSKGGSGSSGVNYADMFIEKNNPLSTEKAKEILAVIATIGSALAAWRFSDALMDGLDKLTGLQKAKRITLGVILSVIGAVINVKAGMGLGNGSLGLGDALTQSAGGMLATAIGGTLIGSSFGHPIIGLAAGIVLGIVSFVAGFSAGVSQKNAKEAIAKVLSESGSPFTVDDIYGDAIKAHADFNVEMRGKIDSITTLADPWVLSSLAYARDLLRQIFALDEIEIKSPQEIAQLKDLVERFNEIGLDGIQLEFDDLTGKVKENKEEIYAAIDALEEKIKKEAMQEALKETYKALWVAQHDLVSITQKRAAAEEAFVDYMHAANIQEALDLYWIAKANGTVSGTAVELFETWSDWNDEVGDSTKNVNDLKDKYILYMDDMKKATQGAATEVRNAFDPKNIIKQSSWADALKSAVSNLPSINFTVSGSNLIPRVQTKASGGFVPSGDLFVAGEAGAELIMAAPNGSEVVNMAQFESAMMNAVSMAGGNGGDWTIVVQDGNGAERSRQVITAAERANRRDGRTIIPVGVY